MHSFTSHGIYRNGISFVNIFLSCRIPPHTFPADPVVSSRNFPDPSFALIICYVSSPSRVIVEAHARSDARVRARARDSRVYLAISILLSEQCICSRRRKVFDELRAAAGAYNACWVLHILFMHIYAYRMRTRTDGRTRNGTLATGRERPDINTCSSRSVFTASVPVRIGPLTSLTEEYEKIYRRRCYYERLRPDAR